MAWTDCYGAFGLEVAFQPVVDLTNGRLVGYEALGRVGPVSSRGRPSASGEPQTAAALEGGSLPLRWGEPRTPASLLDAAFRGGCLLDLDRGWRAVAVEGVARHDPATDRLCFLNVDTRIVDDPRCVPGFAHDIVRRMGLPARRFVLELRETDPKLRGSYLGERTAEVRRRGFRIALDDLGAGHSGLAALVDLRPDWVKIDRDLIAGIAGNRERWHLVRALVDYCGRLDVGLIAEGIERPEDLDALAHAGVRYGQGFLLGRPGPLDTLLGRGRAVARPPLRGPAAPRARLAG
jgi:EAL domain-containing protein (putative c-di-GMP-specific phosphodiesterase class I)